jgi:hypothetical protein
MTPDLRFAKTDKGHEEIRTRTHRLNPKLRSLLVVVDGIKSAGELLQAAMALGSDRAALDTLIQDGFIAVAPAGSAVAPPAPASPAAVAPVADHAAPQVDPEKLRAAKVAMRQYIKLASGVRFYHLDSPPLRLQRARSATWLRQRIQAVRGF